MTFDNQYQRAYVQECQRAGHTLDLSGPARHKPPKAAAKTWPSAAVSLGQLAKVQAKLIAKGTLCYVEPNPFQASC